MKQRRKRRGEQEEKRGFRERLCHALDLSPDLLPGGYTVELRDRNLLTLRGGGKILLYTPEEVRVTLREGCLAVRGRRLCCISYYVGAIGIEGEIDSLSCEGVGQGGNR